MRNILILMFGLLSFSGSSQIAAMLMTEPEAAGATYLLDDYPADAAYSLRLLKADQIDSAAIRVRRSSDNAEQDIGFTSEGYLDTASLKTFVGANSGYVVTWYDQSGNEYDATQSTASQQPQIITSGTVERLGGEPSLKWVAANSTTMTTATVASMSQPFFSASIYKGNTSISNYFFAFANNLSFAARSASDFQLNASANLRLGTPDANMTLISADIDAASSAIFKNGISQGTGNAGSNNTGSVVLNIGSAISAALPIDGYYSEFIFWGSDQSANRTSIESEINTHYSIY